MNQSNRSFLFDRWPRFAVRHPWRVLLGAILVLVALVVASRSLRGSFSDAFSIPNSEAQQAFDVLKARFPQSAGDSATVVVQAPAGVNDPATKTHVETLISELKALPEVVSVASPYDQANSISPDGTIARINVQYDKKAHDIARSSVVALSQLRQSESSSGFRVEIGGQIINRIESMGPGSSEFVGVAAAVVVLLLAFGSVVAMGLPILTALLALGAGILLITIGARFATMPTFTPEFAAMIGLGVGIDYALLIVTRYREGLAHDLSVEDAVTNAAATAGRSVLFAGGTVMIAMFGLWLVGIPFMAYVGTAAAIVVAIAVVIALVVLPAVLKLIGRHIDSLHVPGTSVVARESEQGIAYRLSRSIQKNPLIAMAVSLALLVLLAIPFFSMQIGSSDAGNNPEKFTSRRAYDLLSQGFGPGFNGTIMVVTSISDPKGVDAVSALPDKIKQLPDVVAVTPPRFNADKTAATISVVPSSAPQAQQTATLVHRLRSEVASDTSGTGAKAYVGGTTAAFIDVSDVINSHLPEFFGAVIGLSFLLLLVVFRSVLVPLTAALMNLLAIGAAYGVLVAIFQWGWLGNLIGLSRGGPIESFLPMFLFAVLFGLSMDYEVFLVTRIHEEYLRTGDNSEAVARGLSVTTRLISAAAAIMVCVFLSFAFADNRIIKEFGIGLGTAIFVDATLIRMLLVPSIMQLLGDANWWFPSWLHFVPRLHVEPVPVLAPVPVTADEVDFAG